MGDNDNVTVFKQSSYSVAENPDPGGSLNTTDLTYLLNCSLLGINGTDVLRTDGNFSLCQPPQSTQNRGPAGLPSYMVFGDEHLVSLITYTVLFVIAALGNLTVFITLFKNRHRRSRVNMFIMHLSIADMIVTFIMVPMEIGWHAAVYWRAGDVACRLLMFFRTFGFYLSAFILITISLDRYFAILHPLSLHDAEKRGKLMLAFAWICSTIASIPQSVIFHVAQHPRYKWFTQCVTMGFFPTTAHELAYNLFNVLALYGVPLIVIVTCYAMILWEVTRKAREGTGKNIDVEKLKKRGLVRRSGTGTLEKARVRTLKMTIVIVLVFIMCWTPYFVLSAWWWIDKESAKMINPKVQRWIFTLAVSNSCMDPIVYGMFTTLFRKEAKKYSRRIITYIRESRSVKSVEKSRNNIRMGETPFEQPMAARLLNNIRMSETPMPARLSPSMVLQKDIT